LRVQVTKLTKKNQELEMQISKLLTQLQKRESDQFKTTHALKRKILKLEEELLKVHDQSNLAVREKKRTEKVLTETQKQLETYINVKSLFLEFNHRLKKATKETLIVSTPNLE
jgi:predicted  nucleic acid-binding Zn-ribbon protein